MRPTRTGPHTALARSLMALIVVAGVTGSDELLAQTATDQRCAKGADVRRIEIRFADENGQLPCRVVYRPEAESDTLGIVSWQNLQSVAACRAQADEVIERLTGEGWTCRIDDRPVRAEDEDGVAELLATARDLQEQGQTAEQAAGTDVPATANTITEDADIAADEEESPAEEVDQPARFVANPDLPPPSDDLRTIIEDDLARLDVTLDGTLEARIEAYGDVNADDVEDALALFTYASPQPAYRQFLAVYVFDGEVYRLTATRPVSGNVKATMNARVETIDAGVIHLALSAYQPDDDDCCPSGTQHIALALRDLELVEIDAEAPTR